MNKNEISIYIRNQFPTAYEEGGEKFISFVEAYYEYLDTNYFQNKTVEDSIDIDNTLDEFVDNFKNIYLKDFPYVAATNKKFMIKNILDFYSTKGSVKSTQLLLNLIFGEESKVNLPSLDILKPSDSVWQEPEYIEVSRSDRTISFLNKEVTGSKSRAKGIVEGIVTKRVEGKYIDVVYLSNVKGRFIKDEFITDDGNLRNSPQIIGSLTYISVLNGGRDNKIGDVFEVIGGGGERGKVRVSEVVGATGRVDFSIEEGGFGYTTTSDTNVYISDAILMIKNPDLVYKKFDNIRQDMETIDLISFNNIASNVQLGHYVTGINPAGQTIANGVVVSVRDDGGGDGSLKLLMSSGTFGNQKRLEFAAANTSTISIGDTFEEESFVTLTLSTPTVTVGVGQRIEQNVEIPMSAKTGTITVDSGIATTYQVDEVITYKDAAGDVVISAKIAQIPNSTTLKLINIVSYKAPHAFVVGQTIYGTTSNVETPVIAYNTNPVSPLYTNRVMGVITAVSGAEVTLRNVWGEFSASKTASIYSDENSSSAIGGCMVLDVNYITRGASAKVSLKTDTYVIVEDVSGQFSVSNVIRNKKTKQKLTITSVTNEGATDVRLNGVVSANAAISATSNSTAAGIVIGQNTTAVGVWGNTQPFLSSGNISIPNSLRDIDTLLAGTTNDVTVRTRTNHNYTVGDTISFNIELQQDNEVKRIYGLYEVKTVVNGTSFVVTMETSYADIIRKGNYSFFAAQCDKTIVIVANTKRKEGPEINSIVYSVASGFDASFKVGSLEGEETVFINTDIVGGNNVIDVPYLNINVDGSESGIGYVGAVRVVDGGSQYTNGAVLTFTGGGYGNGDPDMVASGYISTSATGQIVDVTLTDIGQGYYTTPTITLPTTTGTTATLTPLMEHGYGFPKMPEGGIENYLEDLWTSKEMAIGKIASLAEINPGSNYNANPFVLVYNSYIAGFGRTERIVISSQGSASFVVGEMITQNIPGDGGAIVSPKGYVSGIEDDTIYIKRMSFNTSFTAGYPIIGNTSGASRIVLAVEELAGGLVLGDNASIPAIAIAANGIATKLEVIDSGFGYVNDEEVTLFDENKPFVITGRTKISEHGKSEGSWQSVQSHLDGNSRIHDNDYYQEFSYEVVTGKSINKYRRILSDLVHVAGTKMFGKVERRNYQDVSVKTSHNVMEKWSNFSNIPSRIMSVMFNSGENGDILWPSPDRWFSDIAGFNPIIGAGDKVACWRGSNRIVGVNRKNLITWSDNIGSAYWTKSGVVFNAGNNTISTQNTNSQHFISQNVKVEMKKALTASFLVKSSNVKRITVALSGGIDSGYVTYDLLNNSVVASTANYTGTMLNRANGYIKITLTNLRSKTFDQNVTFAVYVNDETGYGIQTFTPTSTLSLIVDDVQLEYGNLVSPYQVVTHGDEWDGVRYIQGKNRDYYPTAAVMPVTGVKNILEKSDDFRNQSWDKLNVTVSANAKIDGEPSSTIRDSVSKVEQTYSIRRMIPNNIQEFDNIGFWVKPNQTSRYVAIRFGNTGMVSIFDLTMGTNVLNEFSDYTINVQEDGSVIIGVFEPNMADIVNPTLNQFELIMMDGNQKSNIQYIGQGNRTVTVLRAYVSNMGYSDNSAAKQKNVSKYNVSEKGIQEAWYLTGDKNSRLIGSIHNYDPHSICIAGPKGIWVEDVSTNTNKSIQIPSDKEILYGLGGVMGVVVMDRGFTSQELSMLETYCQMGGSGAIMTETLDDIDFSSSVLYSNRGLTFDGQQIRSEHLIGSGKVIMPELFGVGLYRMDFNYNMSGNVEELSIVAVYGNTTTIIYSVNTKVRDGIISKYFYQPHETAAVGLSFKGTTGEYVNVTNVTITKYS